jgi:hypothetical protein
VAELPQLAAHVTEYQGHSCTCPACQTITHAAITANLCRHSFGPRASRRVVEEIAQAVIDVTLSLGSIG